MTDKKSSRLCNICKANETRGKLCRKCYLSMKYKPDKRIKYRSLTLEERTELLDDLELINSSIINNLCEKYKVSRSTLFRWKHMIMEDPNFTLF